MLVRLLGATALRRGQEQLPIGSRAVRSLLGGLASTVNAPVSVDTLTRWVWGDDLPERPQAALQTVVSRLRRVLRDADVPATVDGAPGGYALRIDPQAIDVVRFETLVRRARQAVRAGDDAAAVHAFDAALALWHGERALADLTPGPEATAESVRLGELRLAAMQERIEVLLRTHPGAQLLDELARLTGRYPAREGFARLYMTALDAAGRRGDALEAYRRLDRALRDELGIGPDPITRALQADLLAERPLTERPPASPTIEAARRSVRVGAPPAPAAALQVRPELRARVRHAWADQTAVVITQVLAGDGGVGKTQLAAALFRETVESDQFDVAVWVTATSRDAVLAGYAAAYLRVTAQADPPPKDTEAAAAAFLTWLGETDRTWLVVLDDVFDPADLNGLRPQGRSGRVLVTTRRRDAATTALGAVVDVGLFSPGESLAYLRERLSLPQISRTMLDGAEQLAADLGHLPLALAQAAAVIIDDAIGCTDYRTLLADRTLRLSQVFPADPRASGDDYAHALPAAWSLATERATAIEATVPAMLRMVAVLDPNGIPEAVLLSPPVSDYLGLDYLAGPRRARAAIRAAHQFSLLTHTPDDPTRSVRMHALAQRAALDHLTDDELERVVRVAADALLTDWPTNTSTADRVHVMRANTGTLATRHPEALRSPDPHPVVLRAGQDLGQAAHVRKAVEYQANLFARTDAALGPDHPSTLQAQFQLADALGRAGDLEGAVRTFEEILTRRIRVLGPAHRDTLVTRYELATWRGELGGTEAALRELELLVTECARAVGPDDPVTLAARHDRAFWLCETGDHEGAVRAFEALLRDETVVAGRDSPQVLGVRHYLGRARGLAGDVPGAIDELGALIEDAVRILGRVHPYTLMARKTFAHWQGRAGDPAGAVAACLELLDDHRRILGPDHPETLDVRAELADWLGRSGDVGGAIRAYRDLLVDLLRLFGPNHPQTGKTLAALNNWEQQATIPVPSDVAVSADVR